MNPESPPPTAAAPLVSIIIPAYNYAAYLPAAVRSALVQTHEPTEIIVVDDGSTDNTAEVLTPFMNRVRYHRQANRGLSAARNAGMKSAQGEFLVFLDADDQLLPHMVEVSLKTLLSLDPRVDLLASQAFITDANGAIAARKIVPVMRRSREIRRDDLVVTTRFPVPSLIRRKAMEKIGGFDEALRATEDRDAWIRIAEQGRIFHLGEALSLKRIHGTNMSSQAETQTATMRTVVGRAVARTQPLTRRILLRMRATAAMRWSAARLYRNLDMPYRALREAASSTLLWPWFKPYDAGYLCGGTPIFFRLAFMIVTVLRLLGLRKPRHRILAESSSQKSQNSLPGASNPDPAGHFPCEAPVDTNSGAATVEVRVPTYNRPDLLKNALLCLQAQTHPHWRAIVLDDSRDQVGRPVVESFADPRIAYRHNTQWLGICGNLNQAFSRESLNPSGLLEFEFAAVLEDDNLWDPEYLTDSIQRLRASHAVALVRNYRLHERYRDGRVIPKFECPMEELYGHRERLLSWEERALRALHSYSVGNFSWLWRYAQVDLQNAEFVFNAPMQERARAIAVLQPILYTPTALSSFCRFPEAVLKPSTPEVKQAERMGVCEGLRFTGRLLRSLEAGGVAVSEALRTMFRHQNVDSDTVLYLAACGRIEAITKLRSPREWILLGKWMALYGRQSRLSPTLPRQHASPADARPYP